jgi:hypothetical protein
MSASVASEGSSFTPEIMDYWQPWMLCLDLPREVRSGIGGHKLVR